ncbi:MAG: hypothetical protein V4719_09405 [Planctomycetota bacterium]
MTSREMNLSMPDSTYPKELIGNAVELSKLATSEVPRRPRPEMASFTERGFARSAISTAFNALESLLIDLTQWYIEKNLAAKTICKHCASRINWELRDQKANISRTLFEWPGVLFDVDLSKDPDFKKFENIRNFRNNLTHPLLTPFSDKKLDQTTLLLATTAERAHQVIEDIAKMACTLHTVYGVPVPPEFSSPFR